MDFAALQTTATIIAITTGAISVLGFLVGVWRKLQTLTTKLDLFWQDWNGNDARPGRDKVPGVMERLNRIDGELKHNSGSSMKDSMKRVENALERIEERIEKGDARFQEGNEMFKSLDSRITHIEGKIDA